MSNKIRPALDSITAEDALKVKTIHSVTTMMRKKARLGTQPFRYAALAVCLCIVLFLGGCGLYFTPVSTISVDINPSLELSINCFDRVIGTQSFNEDGEILLSSVSLRHRKYEDALSLLLNCDTAATYLAGDADVSIAVLGLTAAHSAEMLRHIQGCDTIAATHLSCHSVSHSAAEAAHHAHLSLGRYEAYLALHALDSTVTEDDVRELSMQEIRLWIESLGGDLSSVPDGSGHGAHHNKSNHH